MLGIITALTFEGNEIIEKMNVTKEEIICNIKFSSGTLNGVDVVIAACGEGKVNAARCAQIMICKYDMDAIINIGVAGGLDKSVGKNDIVLGTRVYQHDYDMSPIGYKQGEIPVRTPENPECTLLNMDCAPALVNSIAGQLDANSIDYKKGVIATGDSFVASEELKTSINTTFNALACEMEGGAIGHVCLMADVDFAVVRIISDNADESANGSYVEYKKIYSISELINLIINKELMESYNG